VANLSRTVLRTTDLEAHDIDRFLVGSPMKALGAYFISAESETGIGADYLLAIACHESAKGTGGWTKPPYCNLFSWGIHDSGPKPSGRFPSFPACITSVAGQLNTILRNPTNFRNVNAKAKGLIPDTLSGMGSWYATDKDWAEKVEAWRQQFLATLDPNEQVLFWAVDSGVFFAPTNGTEPVTRLMLAYALRKLGGNA
jgi:hypothetical protein